MRHPEQDLQISIVSTILAPLEMTGKLTYAAFSNGFKRTKAEAGIAKTMGQRAGAWDLAIFLPNGRCFGIEMKSATGRAAASQLAFAMRLGAFGFGTYICRSQAEVMATLESEGVIPTQGRAA